MGRIRRVTGVWGGVVLVAVGALFAAPAATPIVTGQLGVETGAADAVPEHVQGPPRLDVLITNQTSLTLTNKLGAVNAGRMTHLGHFFAMSGQAALLVRRSESGPLERLWQAGDPIPGTGGIRSELNFLNWFASGAAVSFYVDFLHPNGETQGAILLHDGSSLRTILTGMETAPGSGGRRYERFARPLHLNPAGDLWFSAALAPSGQTAATAVFVARHGMAPERLVGTGDAAPGGGTFESVTVNTANVVNDAGRVVFQGTVGGVNGLFMWTGTEVLSIATEGDLVGGVTLSTFGTHWINASGTVLFQSSGAIFRRLPDGGLERVLAQGDPVPGVNGATLGALSNVVLSDSGFIAFTAAISGWANVTSGVFFVAPGSPVALVAHQGQGTPDTSGGLSNFASTSINDSGAVSFVARVGSAGAGVFQKYPTSPLTKVLATGDASPTGGVYGNVFQGTTTLSSGAVMVPASISGGPSFHAFVLAVPGGSDRSLVGTHDDVPAGGRQVVRELFASGAGHSVVFRAQIAGGRTSLFHVDVRTRQITRLQTDGDGIAGAPGVLATSLSTSTLQVGSSGVVAWTTAGTLMAFTPGIGVQKVARSGDLDAAGTAIAGITFSGQGGPSQYVNAAGKVLFSNTSGVFLATPGSPAVRIARATMATIGGGTLVGSFAAVAVNNAGAVLFRANSRIGSEPSGGVSRFFVVTPEGTPTKVVGVGDASPGGGTFTALSTQPGFNVHGEMAFKATVDGGAGGIFVVGPSTPVSAVALHGAIAPGGGTFVMTGTHQDVQINDRRDVAFRGDLSETPAGSGYFIRRGADGPVHALVRAGQAAPGTDRVFGTFPPTLNNRYGEYFQLNEQGDLAVQGRTEPPSTLPLLGYWRARQDGTLEPMVVRTQTFEELGGAAVLSTSIGSAWLDDSRYLSSLWIGGDEMVSALVLFTPAPTLVTQPSPRTVVSGGQTTFAVAAVTPAAPTYRWQLSTDGGISFSDVANGDVYGGATTSTLSIAAATAGLSGTRYRAVVAHGPATTTSMAAMLTVQTPPAITTPPLSQTVISGQDATFVAVATGDPAPAFRWQVSTNGGGSFTDLMDGPLYNGVTTAVLTVTGTTVGLSGHQYRVVATNVVTAVTSAAATLTVQVPPGACAVSGVIATDTTWSPHTCASYVVTGSILVVHGATLTIAPGTEVRFDGAFKIQVEGQMIAIGTAQQRIVFTSNRPEPAPGDWAGIVFTDTSTDASVIDGVYQSGSALQFADVRYGATVLMFRSSPEISFNRFERNRPETPYSPSYPWDTAVVVCYGEGPSYRIHDNLIARNAGGAIKLECRNAEVFNNLLIGNSATSWASGVTDLSSSAWVHHNVFAENANGQMAGGFFSYSGSAVLEHNAFIANRFDQPGSSIPADRGASAFSTWSSTLTFRRNTVVGHAGARTSHLNSLSSDIRVNDNNFTGNSTTVDIYLNPTTGDSTPIGATANYWGGLTEAQAFSRVFNRTDEFGRILVDVSNQRSTPNLDAPVAPPTGLRIVTEGGTRILRWNASVESDVVGYKVHYDNDAGFPYAGVIDVGDATSAPLTGPLANAHYVAITAYDADADASNDWVEGHESWFSVELPPRVLTVQSQDPSSGVTITVTPDDIAGHGNGSTSFTRAYQESTSVTLTAPATAGINPFERWLKNGVDVGTTTSVTMTMDANHTMTAVYTPTHPAPVLSSLSPAALSAGASGFTLDVTGSGFVSGATVRWNGAARTTTFVSTTHVTAAISAADVAAVGTSTVSVVNPAPTAGASNGLDFTVNPPSPVITTLAPDHVAAGSGATTLTVNGTGFLSGAVVRWNGTARTTVFISSTQLTAAILAGDVEDVGTATITVLNPSPVPGPSNGVTFTITEAPPSLESDVAPRGNPNGMVSTTDWVQVGRFIVDLDTVSATHGEFQRADAAPRATFGDGRITTADWVQAGRYAVGLDPATDAAGPTTIVAERPVVQARGAAPRRVTVTDTSIEAGASGAVTVRLVGTGSEHALAVGVRFDPSVLQFTGASLGADAVHASLVLNESASSLGQLGLLVGLPMGHTWEAGARDVVVLTFSARIGAPALTAVGFDDTIVFGEIADGNGTPMAADFVAGAVNVTASGMPVLSTPIGHVDSPDGRPRVLRGAVGITGWALDDRGDVTVRIYRECLPFDVPAACQTVMGRLLVYVGDAVHVSGARPDVAAAFPAYRDTDRAGWGFLLLTPMLPDVLHRTMHGGEGTLDLFVVATDSDGQQVFLGRSTDPTSAPPSPAIPVTLGNASLAEPFGTIDSPAAGDTVSGIIPLFGWVLTPDGNRQDGDSDDIVIPTDGSMVTVYVDGARVGGVTYGLCRGTVGARPAPGAYCDDDVANVFGGIVPRATIAGRAANPTVFRNLDAGRGAIGAYQLDTTPLPDGPHTLAWHVTDSAGRTTGVGSRLIHVANGPAGSLRSSATRRVDGQQAPRDSDSVPAPGVSDAIWYRTGFDEAGAWHRLETDADGKRRIMFDAIGRVELRFGADVSVTWEVSGTGRPLPTGARVARDTFTWAPPPGYLGDYTLTFVRGGESITITLGVR